MGKGFLTRLDNSISEFFDTYNADFARSEFARLITFLNRHGYTRTVAKLHEALDILVLEHADPERHTRNEVRRAKNKNIVGGLDETA